MKLSDLSECEPTWDDLSACESTWDNLSACEPTWDNLSACEPTWDDLSARSEHSGELTLVLERGARELDPSTIDW